MRALCAAVLAWPVKAVLAAQAADEHESESSASPPSDKDESVVRRDRSAKQHMGWPLWMARGRESYFFDAMTPQGYEVARYLLRDIQAGGISGYPDPWLLRSLAQMQVWWAQYGHHVRFDVTSGMRTPQTNSRIEGAARASLHLPQRNWVFRAVDFRPGRVDPVLAARWARHAGISGLGIYLDRDFLHADTGRVRHWISR